jgi:hypothetical protein
MLSAAIMFEKFSKPSFSEKQKAINDVFCFYDNILLISEETVKTSSILSVSSFSRSSFYTNTFGTLILYTLSLPRFRLVPSIFYSVSNETKQKIETVIGEFFLIFSHCC